MQKMYLDREHLSANKPEPRQINGLDRKIDDVNKLKFFWSSPAKKNLVTFIDLLCEHIQGTGNRVYNSKYKLENEVFKRCAQFLGQLEDSCEDTDINTTKVSGNRFGHLAYRDWFDDMKTKSVRFISELTNAKDGDLDNELLTYITESFGNRWRIDYGTGHELNFIIFTMGLSNLVDLDEKFTSLVVTSQKLKAFVHKYGWDIHSLFAQKYLRLVRKVQTKFRLEPAGSRGVYNMDDFQFLPFLFGASQLSCIKYIPVSTFYQRDNVDMFKSDFIFMEAVAFILDNKRGPFNEHSYTLYKFTELGLWEKIQRRIRIKFEEDILRPYPIVQHLLFGKYIMRWEPEQQETTS